jgi:formate C-acetyltransferase
MPSTAALSMTQKEENAWRNFNPGDWCTSIAVRDFIVRNATPYTGDEKFLAAPTARTKTVWDKLRPYFIEEQKKGVLAADAKTPSTMLAHKPGYIDQKNEVIVGLQTDQPFKRAIFPYGGLRMVEAGLKAAGIDADPLVHEAFTKYRKTHNDGVFDAYTDYRAAGFLWPRPHHRRLPAGRALRRCAADRGQAGGASAGRRHVADGRDHPGA